MGKWIKRREVVDGARRFRSEKMWERYATALEGKRSVWLSESRRETKECAVER